MDRRGAARTRGTVPAPGPRRFAQTHGRIASGFGIVQQHRDLCGAVAMTVEPLDQAKGIEAGSHRIRHGGCCVHEPVPVSIAAKQRYGERSQRRRDARIG